MFLQNKVEDPPDATFESVKSIFHAFIPLFNETFIIFFLNVSII